MADQQIEQIGYLRRVKNVTAPFERLQHRLQRGEHLYVPLPRVRKTTAAQAELGTGQ
ncbi:hypothetical protein [Streptomyces sp. NPDC090112]|uniref:hypothetical protein n=1 Tax=Streptomyces sp. NPDC090112 TaxID=3365949 RepID=UPI0037F31A16